MELEILKLVYDYSINRKLVNFKFIDKLIEIVVSKRSLNDYVKRIRFTNDLEKDSSVTCAGYNIFTKEVVVDYESIDIILENESYYEQLFSSFEQVFFRNLIVTQIILHELEHAYQHKLTSNRADTSLETKLINASFVLEQALKNPRVLQAVLKGEIPEHEFIIYISQNRELYKRYYQLNPTEKLAQVNSFRTILNLLDQIKENVPNLYEFEQASLIEAMLKGYQDCWNQGICPTQVYLLGVGQEKVWSQLDFYSCDYKKLMENVCLMYSLANRFSFGLPVIYDEYKWLDDCLQRTNKFNV